MTFFGKLTATAVLMVATASAANAAQVVIDFDSVPQGTILTTEYPGVSFSGAYVLTAPNYNSSGFPPHSGTNVLYNYANASLDISFANATTFAGAYVTGLQQITLTAYNGATVVGSTVFAGGNANGNGTPNYFLSFTGPAFTSISFTDGSAGNSYTLDDLTYNAVPEPATWALMIAGFGFVGLASRRRMTLTA